MEMGANSSKKKKVFEVTHLLSPGDLAEMLPLLWAQSKACRESI